MACHPNLELCSLGVRMSSDPSIRVPFHSPVQVSPLGHRTRPNRSRHHRLPQNKFKPARTHNKQTNKNNWNSKWIGYLDRLGKVGCGMHGGAVALRHLLYIIISYAISFSFHLSSEWARLGDDESRRCAPGFEVSAGLDMLFLRLERRKKM